MIYTLAENQFCMDFHGIDVVQMISQYWWPADYMIRENDRKLIFFTTDNIIANFLIIQYN